jgi:hypothetical protein
MKKIALFSLLGVLAFAQAATRTVVLTWTGGGPQYAISRVQLPGTTATVLTPSAISTLTFTDTTAVVGQTYQYNVYSVAPPCTPTTAVTATCGANQSTPVTVTQPIPNPPTPATTVVVSVN